MAAEPDTNSQRADSFAPNTKKEEILENSENMSENDAQLTEEEDDDFGSFDDASFEEFQAPEPEITQGTATDTKFQFTSTIISDLEPFQTKLDELLDSIFPEADLETNGSNTTLLRPQANDKLATLSRPPRLNPPNWIKLKIRHNLLIKLGVPINLDELESPNSVSITKSAVSHYRRRSVNEQDIDFGEFDIPEFEQLNISSDQKEELLHKTNQLLSKIEEDNLNNTSQIFLESSLDESLDAKLAQLRENFKQVIELSSVWQDQIKELRNSQEIYESVVQNMVGYSQKLQRNEFIEHLKKKGKKGKRTF